MAKKMEVQSRKPGKPRPFKKKKGNAPARTSRSGNGTKLRR